MGSETGGGKCDARSRFCARKRSVAAGADRAAYAQRGRHGKSLPAARAEPLRARVAGRDGAGFRRGGIGKMAEESTEKRKRRTVRAARAADVQPRKTLGAARECPIKDLAARRGIFTHAQFETEIRPQLVELVKPGTI